MEWEIVVAMALAAPIILLPVAFVGYLTSAGSTGGEGRLARPLGSQSDSLGSPEGSESGN